MKKYIPVLLLVCAALCMSACMNDAAPQSTPAPSASPALSMEPLRSPTPSPVVSGPDTGIAGSGGMLSDGKVEGTAEGELAGGVAGAVIEGFEHGKQVLESEVPQVMDAIEGKYPGAKVTGISMAEHEGKQVYHVSIEGAGDTTEVYVDPRGSIMPFVAGTGAEIVQ